MTPTHLVTDTGVLDLVEGGAVHPVPDTEKLLRMLSRIGQPEAEASLLLMGRWAQAIVPQCVGLSLALVRENLTFTLVPTPSERAGIADRHLNGGPDERLENGEPTDMSSSALLAMAEVESRRFLSSTTREAVVASSLSMPIVEDGGVVAYVTMYAATATAFEGRHEVIAAALGASARRASANSDLAFESRAEARRSRVRFGEQIDVDVALGIVAATHDVSIDEASERLEYAASRAGVTRPQAARVVRHLR
jgi:hypothetical protein